MGLGGNDGRVQHLSLGSGFADFRAYARVVFPAIHSCPQEAASYPRFRSQSTTRMDISRLDRCAGVGTDRATATLTGNRADSRARSERHNRDVGVLFVLR